MFIWGFWASQLYILLWWLLLEGQPKTLAQVIFCEFCEISKNNSFYGTPLVTAPELCGNRVFPQNFHTRKLVEYTLFYAVKYTSLLQHLSSFKTSPFNWLNKKMIQLTKALYTFDACCTEFNIYTFILSLFLSCLWFYFQFDD